VLLQVVVPETPLAKAQSLVNRVLKEANLCRILGMYIQVIRAV